MEFEQLKVGLLSLLEHARAEERRMIEDLTDAQRARPGVPGRWSAKDLVAHLAAWRRQTALTLTAASREEALPFVNDVNLFNASVHQQHELWEWPEILADMDAAYAQLIASVMSATEAELTDSSRFAWGNGLPLWKLVMCDGYEHPVQHLTRFYTKNGDSTRAIQVQVSSVNAIAKHLRDPEYSSYALYDLGCLHLRAGNREDAVFALRAAFRKNPDLVSVSQEDPELESVRAELASEEEVAPETPPRKGPGYSY